MKQSKRQQNRTPTDNCHLTLDFVSDSLNRKIRKLIQKTNLPVNLVSKPAKPLKFALGHKKKKRKTYTLSALSATNSPKPTVVKTA